MKIFFFIILASVLGTNMLYADVTKSDNNINITTSYQLKSIAHEGLLSIKLSWKNKHLGVFGLPTAKQYAIGDSLQLSNGNGFFTMVSLDTSIYRVVRGIKQEGTSQEIKIAGVLDSYVLFKDSLQLLIPLHIQNDTPFVTGYIFWLGQDGNNYPNGRIKFKVAVPIPQTIIETKSIQQQHLTKIFLICFLAGLLAIITPCVFPLIPVTVSYFLKIGGNHVKGIQNALIYSFAIIIIYTLPTILLTMAFGDSILYKITTSPITNLLFFVIFILFAFSFFGAFELTLPYNWASKTDKQVSRGGIVGIFFMALTLVIVSFSCTGPLIGTLLGETATIGLNLAPVIGMLGFGFGLSVPFSLFAVFPNLLKSLPKSGGWLSSVKTVFGFLELALALKFLSNVDLIYHWGLLNRDVFLSLWISIFFLLGLYLLGKLKIGHEEESINYVSVPRLILVILSFSFTCYMIPGLWGAPLKSLTGFLPPSSAMDFNLNEIQYKLDNINLSTSANHIDVDLLPKKYTDILHVPFGLTAYFDLDEGLRAAKVLHKPIMLDFTGHSCANCRKMEAEVWSDPAVLSTIKDDFILVSLYVDESQELPVAEQYTNKRGDRIETVGQKNLDYEITKFGFNAQPLYMFINADAALLSNKKYGYNPSVQIFLDHLKEVLRNFNSIGK
ncbi:MAG: cytochrome c biogenesis protein CcdA [Phycisphaerales bacterium]|nr:cytochrome c biogenesis protein CcdA [Phycisphaerales bacterium]